MTPIDGVSHNALPRAPRWSTRVIAAGTMVCALAAGSIGVAQTQSRPRQGTVTIDEGTSTVRMSDLEWLREVQRTGRDPEVAALGRCSRLLKNGIQAWQIIPRNVNDCDELRTVRSSQDEVAAGARSCWERIGQIATDLTHAHDNFIEMDRLRNRPESATYRERGSQLAQKAAAQMHELDECIRSVEAVQRRVQQRIAGAVQQQDGGGTPRHGGTGDEGGKPGSSTGSGPQTGGTGGGTSSGTRDGGPTGCRPPTLGHPVPVGWQPAGALVEEFASGRCTRFHCPGETDDRVLCPGWPRPVRGADLFSDSDRACRNAVPPPYCNRVVARPPSAPTFGSCVNMRASPDAVDRTLADRDPKSYNCHFYTFTFVDAKLPWQADAHLGATVDLGPTHLARRGFRRLGPKEMARVGDVVLVPGQMRIGATTSTAYIHSARVLAVNEKGVIVQLRQKPDPEHCVVDTTVDEFRRVYRSTTGQYEIWRKG